MPGCPRYASACGDIIENLEDLSVHRQFDVTREQVMAVLELVAESLRPASGSKSRYDEVRDNLSNVAGVQLSTNLESMPSVLAARNSPS